MKGSRLAFTKTVIGLLWHFYSGPNNHALILTIACYSNFIWLHRQNQIKLMVWINKMDKQN